MTSAMTEIVALLKLSAVSAAHLALEQLLDRLLVLLALVTQVAARRLGLNEFSLHIDRPGREIGPRQKVCVAGGASVTERAPRPPMPHGDYGAPPILA